MHLFSLAGMTALLAAGTAHAGPAEWVQDPDTIIRVDDSDAGHGADYHSFSRTIRTSGGDGPIVMLNCQAMSTGDYSMNTAIQLDPENTYEQDPSTRLRLLSLSGILTIDGKKKADKYQYHPDSSKIVPFDKVIAKKLYNAVIKGSDVKLKIQGKTYDLALPAANDAFVSFAKTCPSTNGGKFKKDLFEAMETSLTTVD